MPGISVTEQLDSLLSTTLKNYSRKLRDNFFNSFPTLKYLKAKGRVQHEDGGTFIVEHLLYEQNTTVKSLTGYGLLDTTPQEGITQAIYDWRTYAGTITISRDEERKNSGKHRLLSLLQAKIDQAEMSLKNKWNTDFFADITSSPTTAIDGIFLHISSTPSTTTLGRVSGNTYTWWRNYQADVGVYANNLESKLRTAYNSCSAGGGDFVDAIICSQNALEYYEGLAVTQKRFVNEQMSADLGFKVLTYKGAEMFWDAGIGSNNPETGETMIGLNTKASRLVIDKDSDFVTTEFIVPDNQLAKVAKVILMANFVTNERRKNFLLHGIDES